MASSSRTGAIKKKGSRESARLNPSGLELMLTGLSPRATFEEPLSNVNPSRRELNLSPSIEVQIPATAQLTNPPSAVGDMIDPLNSRPLIQRTPPMDRNQNLGVNHNTSGTAGLNTSTESNSILAPTFSSLSHQGAGLADADQNPPSFRNMHISEANNVDNSAEARNFDTVPNSFKSYINYALVNAFESYSQSISSDISESVKRSVRANFIEFLGDINSVSLPLRDNNLTKKSAIHNTVNIETPAPGHQQQNARLDHAHPQQQAPLNPLSYSHIQRSEKNPPYSFPTQPLQGVTKRPTQNMFAPQPPILNHLIQHPQPNPRPNRKPQQFLQQSFNHQPQTNMGQNYQFSNIPTVSQSYTFKSMPGTSTNSDMHFQAPFASQIPETGIPNLQQSSPNLSRTSNTHCNRNYSEQVKIDRWNLKFDGTPENLSVEDFIFRLETLQRQYDCPWSEVLRQFHLMLTGDAATWYYEFHKVNTRPDWPSMREALLLHYRTCKSDYQILRELSDRKQGPSETCDQYFGALMKIRSQLKISIPESEVIKMIKGNLNEKIGPLVYPMSIFSVDQLRFVCKEAENTFPSSSPHGSRQYRPAQRFHVNETQCEVYSQEPHEDRVATMQYESHNRPRPPNKTLGCWNCKITGHLYWDCPSPRQNIFCFKCGEANVIVSNCPKCHQKNGQKSAIPTGEWRSKPVPETPTSQLP